METLPTDMVEIAYSDKFVCPTPESVALLRTEEGKKLSAQGLEAFTILIVPRRVSEILKGFSYEEYIGVMAGREFPRNVIEKAYSRSA